MNPDEFEDIRDWGEKKGLCHRKIGQELGREAKRPNEFLIFVPRNTLLFQYSCSQHPCPNSRLLEPQAWKPSVSLTDFIT